MKIEKLDRMQLETAIWRLSTVICHINYDGLSKSEKHIFRILKDLNLVEIDKEGVVRPQEDL